MTFTRAEVRRSVDSTTTPAYATDADGRILGWNRAAEIALGHSRHDVLDRLCHTVIRGRDAFGNRVCRPDCPVKRRAKRGDPIHRFRMYARTDSGHYVDVECSTLCIPSESGGQLIVHLVPTATREPDRGVLSPRGQSPPVDAAPEKLSKREVEVLQLLAAGRGTRELAAELSISVATVRSHIESIFRKLDVHSRLQAVVAATRRGIL